LERLEQFSSQLNLQSAPEILHPVAWPHVERTDQLTIGKANSKLILKCCSCPDVRFISAISLLTPEFRQKLYSLTQNGQRKLPLRQHQI
jgi:hypothetical protein